MWLEQIGEKDFIQKANQFIDSVTNGEVSDDEIYAQPEHKLLQREIEFFRNRELTK